MIKSLEVDSQISNAAFKLTRYLSLIILRPQLWFVLTCLLAVLTAQVQATSHVCMASMQQMGAMHEHHQVELEHKEHQAHQASADRHSQSNHAGHLSHMHQNHVASADMTTDNSVNNQMTVDTQMDCCSSSCMCAQSGCGSVTAGLVGQEIAQYDSKLLPAQLTLSSFISLDLSEHSKPPINA